MSDKGFIVIDRCLEDWQYADVETACYLWLRILLRANWKDGWFMGTPIPRGSFATSIKSFAEQTKLTEKAVRYWLKKFEEAGQISVNGANRFSVITVINYAKYQDYYPAQGEPRANQGQTEGEPRASQGQTKGDNRTIETKKQRNNSNQVTNSYRRFVPPTLDEITDYVNENLYLVEPNRFFDYYSATGWVLSNGNKMKDWKATVRNWNRNEQKNVAKADKGGLPFDDI